MGHPPDLSKRSDSGDLSARGSTLTTPRQTTAHEVVKHLALGAFPGTHGVPRHFFQPPPHLQSRKSSPWRVDGRGFDARDIIISAKIYIDQAIYKNVSVYEP